MSGVRITSPVTGETLAEVVEPERSVVAAAVAAAAATVASPADRARIARDRLARCDRLDAAAALLIERRQALATGLVLEHGKPLGEALAEVTETAAQLRQTASYARTFARPVPPLADRDMRLLFSEEPLGVVGVITPWNFPLFIPVEYLGPALAMGAPVVWKPAESTPASNAGLLAALRDAGFGEPELTMVTGGPAAGAALVDAPGVAALGFTGSSAVGERISATAGGRPLLLELGGNGPTVVLEDADVATAARAIASSSFGCSGQSCSATGRILAHAKVAGPLVEALVDEAAGWALGDPRDAATRLGPLHLSATAAKVTEHVDGARARGARVAAGGRVAQGFPTDRYWPATVVEHVDPGTALFREETFGPVAPVATFRDELELASLAIAGAWGLSAAVFGTDVQRAARVADLLPAGLVVLNDHSDWFEAPVPVGGGPGTRSGTGRLGIENVLRFVSATKVVALRLPGHAG